jgi:hypothetical protein
LRGLVAAADYAEARAMQIAIGVADVQHQSSYDGSLDIFAQPHHGLYCSSDPGMDDDLRAAWRTP